MSTNSEKQKDHWAISTTRFNVFPATDPADRQACIQVLEEVRRNELNRVAGNSVLDSHALSGENQKFILMACQDTNTGDIIGCMRLTPAYDLLSVPASREEYALDRIPEIHLKSLYIFTRLAVLRHYRRTLAAMVLMSESMAYLVAKGVSGALLACEPNLFTMYQQIGMRQIGPLRNSPSGGYRVPMIFLIDREYLSSINSPAVRWTQKMEAPHLDSINQWFRKWYRENNTFHLGISRLEEAGVAPAVHEVLTKGLSEAGLQAFLKNALVVECQENDVLIAEKDGSQSLGIILNGAVRVVIEGKALFQLEPGELFGEIAFVLDSKRTARLEAAKPDTRILLFSASAYQRLSIEADRICFWRNLALVLAKRVLASDKLLV